MSHIAEIAHEIDELGPLAPALVDYAPARSRAACAVEVARELMRRPAITADAPVFAHPDRRIRGAMALTAYFMLATGCPEATAWGWASRMSTKRGTIFAEQTWR